MYRKQTIQNETSPLVDIKSLFTGLANYTSIYDTPDLLTDYEFKQTFKYHFITNNYQIQYRSSGECARVLSASLFNST